MAWLDTTLGDIVRLQRGHDLSEQHREKGTVPVVGSAGVSGYHNVARTRGPGVSVGRNGASIGKVHFTPCDFWPHNTTLFVTDFLGNDPRFIAYFLSTLDLASFNSGSAQPSLNRNIIYGCRVRVPSLSSQRRIAAILSAYDDLIENNTRRIVTLEEIARRLYEEWFVNFRFPGHVGVKMVESEIGKVPDGWEIKSLYDVAEVTFGYRFKSKYFNETEDGEGVIRIRDIKAGRTKTFTLEEGKPQHWVTNGDILIGIDGQFHMGKWSGGEAWLNQRVARLRPSSGVSRYHLFLAVEGPIKQLEKTIVGTTVAHLSARDMKAMKLAVPHGDLLDRTAEALEPMFDLEMNLRLKNINLRMHRDLLLPKLISGEIDLSEVGEPSVEVAAS